jgi:hypothetical protein
MPVRAKRKAKLPRKPKNLNPAFSGVFFDLVFFEMLLWTKFESLL